jgi:hypothetical protein
MQQIQTTNPIESFSQQLHNLVYLSAQINTDEYKNQGYEKSKESHGSTEIFKAEYNNIKEQIRIYALDDSLSSKKNLLSSNIANAFENKKIDIETEKQNDIKVCKNNNELDKKHLTDKSTTNKQDKLVLESGNQNTGEKGLLNINNEIEKNKLEKRAIDQSIVVKNFASVGTILVAIFLTICLFYLSIFFASALYKVFFEGNIIKNSLEANINPGVPQIIDANAIVKIFKQQGTLFGIISALMFLFPIALTNLKILKSTNKIINIICFWVGLVVFDILVSGMVALNTEKIESLLIGKQSTMQFWEVIKHGEFYLIFIFGMLPLFITHFLIDYIAIAYQKSQREMVDAEKSKNLQILDLELIELNGEKEILTKKVNNLDEILIEVNGKIVDLEKEMNNQLNQIDSKYSELLKQTKNIFEDYNAKIISGKIFTDVILESIVSSFQTGFIGYLPEFYAENEVANRIREIEQVIKTNN